METRSQQFCWSHLMRHEVRFNFLFWWLAFGYLVWINWGLLGSLEGLVDKQKTWVMVISGLQAAVLVLTIGTADGFVQTLRRTSISWIWSCTIAAGLFTYWLDALLFKKTAVHFDSAFRLLSGSDWRQLLFSQEITGVQSKYLGGLAALVIGGVALGGCTLRISWHWFAAYHVRFRLKSSVVVLAMLAVFVFGWEIFDRRKASSYRVWQEISRTMPFSFGLRKLPPGTAVHVGKLSPPRLPTETALQYPIEGPQKNLPDVVLICVESMRGDFVDAITTPNLMELKKDCLEFSDTLASSNASHTSWYSLLTSNEPIYFGMVLRKPALWGSIPLQLFRKMGYQVCVLSSSYLHYHKADQMVFGSNLELADTFLDARDPEIGGLSRPERDKEITRRLLQELGRNSGGRLFLVFYIAPHHDYHWPDDFAAPFQPVAEMWNYYLRFDVSPHELTGIKNRYKNSLHFIDYLTGQIVEHLKNSDRYDSTVLCLTGDHGEEFLEHGKLVHASQLYREQTHVPILLKLPRVSNNSHLRAAGNRPVASHVDILPTILDYLGTCPEDLDGSSLLKSNHRPKLIVDDNGDRDPFQFCLQTTDFKAWFRYRSPAISIALEDTIYLTRVTDVRDRAMDGAGKEERLALMRGHFADGIRRLFPNWRE